MPVDGDDEEETVKIVQLVKSDEPLVSKTKQTVLVHTSSKHLEIAAKRFNTNEQETKGYKYQIQKNYLM